jgi:hypothetical protein
MLAPGAQIMLVEIVQKRRAPRTLLLPHKVKDI